MKLEYAISKNDENKKIKDILLNRLNISHRLLITLKTKNKIYLNSNPSPIYKIVKENDIIDIYFDYEEDNSNIIPKEIPFEIVYEDKWLLVVNKSPSLPVHPSMLHFEDSLSNGIRFYFDKIGLKKKIRPVNRLDKDTSGLVIFAKCEYIQEALIKQMKENLFKKEYIAVVQGIFQRRITSPRRLGMTYTFFSTKARKKIYHTAVATLQKYKIHTIDAPIARKENSIIERCIDNNGIPSITEYEVIKESLEKNFSVVKCNLKTGRTHQIRVHMSYIGHPLLGDTLYGTKSELINRQALHSNKITFIHPITNKKITLEAKIPDDMKKIIK